MHKALTFGILTVNGVSAVALVDKKQVYQSVPYKPFDWEYGNLGYDQFDLGDFDTFDAEKGEYFPRKEHAYADPYGRYGTPEPVEAHQYNEGHRERTGTYEFPGRTDWGPDPDYFSWNDGGYASHQAYNKKLDFDTVIRPWRTRETHKPAKKEHYHEALTHPKSPLHLEPNSDSDDDIPTTFTSPNGHVPGQFYQPGKLKKNVGGHPLGNFNTPVRYEPEPIPDAFDYGNLRWATQHGLTHFSDHGVGPTHKKEHGYSRFSYLKGADDFGDEECFDC